MKIRQGFVSNSSSSSFMVGVDKKIKIEDVNISITKPIADLVKWNISSKKKADEYFNYLYDGDCDTILKNKDGYFDYEIDDVKKVLKTLKKDKTILICDVSNDSDGLSNAIYDMVENSDDENILIDNGDILRIYE